MVGRFVQDGRLVVVPTRRHKRLRVLDRVVQSSEPGDHHPETEVDEVQRGFHDDVAMLRRYLVEEGFLDRAGGVHRRGGGSVPL